MHELSVAMDLVDVACEALTKLGGGEILAIHLKLGRLSGIDADCLRAAYEMARAGSPLAGATWLSRIRPLPFFAPPATGSRRPSPSRTSAVQPAGVSVRSCAAVNSN